MKSSLVEKLLSRVDLLNSQELKLLIHRIIHEKSLFEDVFQVINDGIICLDHSRRVIQLNPVACGFFNILAEESIGKLLNQLVKGLDLEDFWEQDSPRHMISRELEVFYPERRYLQLYMKELPQQEHQKPLGSVLIIRDMTQARVEAERTLESERLNSLTLLAAGVAHEIGNPLNSIDIHLQLLERKMKRLTKEAQSAMSDHLNIARAEMKRLDSTLKQFLNAIRPSTPNRSLHKMEQVIHDTLHLLEPELSARNIVITLELAEDAPSIRIDADQFHQIFYNLISNAYQALPSQNGVILISSKITDYDYEITIRDNGVGISSDHMKKIFEPYMTTKASGTGLGLLIVRRIIREHGGDIEINSELDQGTSITLRLPLDKPRIRRLQAPDTVIDLQ